MVWLADGTGGFTNRSGNLAGGALPIRGLDAGDPVQRTGTADPSTTLAGAALSNGRL